jgi:hypothetical protein
MKEKWLGVGCTLPHRSWWSDACARLMTAVLALDTKISLMRSGAKAPIGLYNDG